MVIDRVILRGSTYELDCHLLVVEEVRPFEDNAKRPLSNLFPNPVVHTDDV